MGGASSEDDDIIAGPRAAASLGDKIAQRGGGARLAMRGGGATGARAAPRGRPRGAGSPPPLQQLPADAMRRRREANPRDTPEGGANVEYP